MTTPSLIKRSQAVFAAITLAASFVAMPVHAQDTASAPAAMASEAAAPASVEAPAPAPIADATTTKETVDNPYGLGALWAQGDFVARGTLMILVIMSMGSWYILITKLWESFKISRQAREARKGFFKATNLNDAVKTLKDGSAFRFIAESGVAASEHHEGALTENIDRNTWVTTSVQRSIDDVQSRLQDGLAVLATVGSTAPFVGLFGTVWASTTR
jgi:biopolymer transport protein ExbB